MSLTFCYSKIPLDDTAQIEQDLIGRLSRQEQLIWLVSGGSNIELSVKIMNAIPKNIRKNLLILQTDERFGDYDHTDSNWRQLRDAGFEAEGATAVPVLTPDNLTCEETTRRYNQIVEKAFNHADAIIGQFGMGADGHIAGVLPKSPAITDTSYVASYKADDFMRITLTLAALKRLSAVYVFVYGLSKKTTLDTLRTETVSFEKQPAQLLKKLPEAYVYSDQINEKGARP